MANKNIAIIGTVGIPANYGGFETLAENLVTHLSSEFNITVFCSGKAYDKRLETYKGAKLRYINLSANGPESIFYDIFSIFRSLKFADVLLILGVSGCVSLPFVRLLSRKKIVVNIDGLEWKREKWGRFARWFLKLSEMLAVRYADVIIADNRIIQEYIAKEYSKPSELIPYGGDHAQFEPLDEKILDSFPFLKERYAFKVCRIEPENNVEMVLDTFRDYRRLNLVLVGNWHSNSYALALKKKYSSDTNIFLLDAIYDKKILNQLRSNCYVYIHGHSAGGTNPSLVEAMYLGLPIFAYDVSYNRATTMNRAKYFRDKKELINLLSNTDLVTLKNIGKDMEEIARQNYTWQKISERYRGTLLE